MRRGYVAGAPRFWISTGCQFGLGAFDVQYVLRDARKCTSSIQISRNQSLRWTGEAPVLQASCFAGRQTSSLLAASFFALFAQFKTPGMPTTQTSLQRLARREWWLWFSCILVTALAGVVLLLSTFRSLFSVRDHIYEISAAQARWSAFDLLLIFNAWMIYRFWLFRRTRRELSQPDDEAGQDGRISTGFTPQDSFRVDPVTGLCTRPSFEHLLGKHVARSRRRNSPLSLVAVCLDDFASFRQRFGASSADLVVKEFANRLQRASRGIDFAVRLGADTFLLALPECSLNDAKRVLDRLGDLEMEVSGEDVTLTHSVSWIDYKPGEVPSELIRRAEQVLQIYGKANKEESSSVATKRR